MSAADERLIEAALAGEADAAALAGLERRLLAEPVLLRRYAAAARLRAQLRAAIGAHGERAAAGLSAPRRAQRRRPVPAWRWPVLAAAAVLALALGWWLLPGAAPPALLRAGDGQALADGAEVAGPQVLRAADGSRFSLAAGGALRVALREDGMELALAAGAVEAEVAAQPAGRRIGVRTAHALVSVVGTRFQVATSATATSVAVDSGVVAVADAQGGRRELRAGDRAFASAAGLAGRVVRVAPEAGLAGVQRALDAARPGDAILLAAGRYAGHAGVDHALRLAGAGAPGAPITLAGEPAGASVLVSASWQGLAIAASARHVRVLDVALEADPAMPPGVVGNGISLRGARQVEIRGCRVRGFPGDGLALIGGDGLVISGNHVEGCSLRSPWGQGGISLKSSLAAPGAPPLGVVIEGNRISGCRDTLPNQNGGGREYTGGNGIGLWEHAPAPDADPPYPGYPGSAIVVRGNHCQGNDGAGIRIHASPGVRLIGNRLEGNGLGPGRPPELGGAETAVVEP